ncbi:CoA-binding protein [Natrarchaeobaculum aegyptiacum]|uniref:CoA-binding protein n=1 Tax=Natrarchaeobaculum aegyptiacum TaxID=745377 RepID=A0A2Z2HY63_9EURY|nr:CoA-binding protein [Natrarchaeobaculum aegyptiacum]ARS91265.1 CoA-binding protein [Natrarchaeobaculum aegyptiacum]
MPLEEDDEIEAVLEYETVAVVGCSTTPGKAAHDVPAYLAEHGYEVIPVNPYADEVLDREAVDSLLAVDEEIDVVCVFRPSEEVDGIVDAALERDDVSVIWTQLGIRDDDAAARAEADGRSVVQDRCMKVEHRRLAA